MTKSFSIKTIKALHSQASDCIMLFTYYPVTPKGRGYGIVFASVCLFVSPHSYLKNYWISHISTQHKVCLWLGPYPDDFSRIVYCDCLALSEYKIQNLFIESGLYFHTRWGLPSAWSPSNLIPIQIGDPKTDLDRKSKNVLAFLPIPASKTLCVLRHLLLTICNKSVLIIHFQCTGLCGHKFVFAVFFFLFVVTGLFLI